MGKQHAVTILNQKLVVRSDATDESVSEIASLVQERIRTVLDGSKSASMLTATLLVCLNIADELQQLKRVRGAAAARAAQKLREVIGLVDAHLAAGG